MKKFTPFVVGALLIAVLTVFASRLEAQSATTGALSGSVADPTGATVLGVTVTLINTATGQTQTTTTDANGLYGFSLLPPGTYEVDFFASGFKMAQAASVVVNVSEAPILNARMEAGASEERMMCRCMMSQAATSSSGTLVDSKTITSVPLTTRNFTQVMSMSAGSAANVNNAGALGTGSQSATVNGNSNGGTYTIDGAASPSTVPNPDAISEFKIQTSQYDAGYGARVPNTNLITRSGANEFHGDAWEFVRNDIFNANDFFQNASGQPKPNLKQNQFGGTLGGPVKKDKLFIFGSYQGTRQTNGLDPSSHAVILLPPLTNDRSATTIASQFCPGNHPSDARFLTFAGGKQLDCANLDTANTASINPVALKLLQMKLPDGSGYVIPTPQISLANGLGQSSFSIPSTYRENQFLGNLDYVISKKHSLSGRFYYAGTVANRSLGANLFTSPATPNVPGFPQINDAKDYLTSAKLTSVITNNLVNEARMTFTRAPSVSTGPNDLATASIGMVSVDPFLTIAPDITIQGSLGGLRIGNAQNQAAQKNDTYTWSDNLSWVHGKHNIRTGAYVLHQFSQLFDTGPARGKITFQNFTDFLLGLDAAHNLSPKGFSNVQSIDAKEGPGPQGEIVYSNNANYVAIFAEDDFKIAPRLTLNLGLRWEYFPPSVDPLAASDWPSLLALMPIPPVSGTYIGTTVPSSYDPTQVNPYTSLPFGAPPAGVLVRSHAGLFENGTSLATFAPRFGFAWQPGSKQSRLAVRGGYGWFYQPTSDRGNAPGFPLVNTQPFAQLSQNAGASNSTSTFQQPFPTTTLGFVLRTPSSRLTDRIIGPDREVPKVQQWNVNLQYSFSKTFSLDLGYVGSAGSHLLVGYASNQPYLATAGHPVNCGLPTTPAGLGVSATTFGTLGIDGAGCVTTNTSGNAYLRVPIIGEIPTALVAHQNLARSTFNSMQATLRKQASHGLTFQVAYTFSKALANQTAFNDQRNLDLDYARTSTDRTHRLIANFNYDLPAIKTDGFAAPLVKGWSMSGIIIVQSGSPMTLTDRSAGSVYGFAGPSTITMCPGAAYTDLVTSGRAESRLDHWFGKSTSGIICNPPALGADGSLGYGNASQSIVNGPGQFNTDFSVGKTTTVGGLREDAQLAFRVELYNALNHPQFSNPGTTFGTSTFGVITGTSVAPRLIQFGMKYLF